VTPKGFRRGSGCIASLCTSVVLVVLSKPLLDNDGETMPLRAGKSGLKMGERAPLKPATHFFSALDGASSPCGSCWLLACLLLPPAYSHKPPAPPVRPDKPQRSVEKGEETQQYEEEIAIS
jgi:hypothetical protein